MATQQTAFGNRAKQTTTTQNTGTYSLDGAAVSPFQSLKAAMIKRTGDAVGPWKIKRYFVADSVDYEICSGTLTSGSPDTLTRARVIESTNGGAAVNWGAGVRNIWIGADANALDTMPGMSEESELTIAGGSVTPRFGLHTIDTEADAASDDLDNLAQTHFDEGALIFIRPVTAARVVNVRHNQGTTGKILLRDSATVALNATTKTLVLKRVGTTWEEVARFGFSADLDVVNLFTKIQKWAKGADVASAGALSLGDDGNYFDITGTTTINSIGTKGVGTVVKLHFDAACQLTHHATDLILPGAANITTAAGDEFEFTEYATGDWRCTGYALASGRSVVSPSNASDSAAGVIEIAVQSEIETATDTVRAVPPGRMQYHPGVAKAWVYITTSGGVVTTAASHNVSSVTDNAAGDFTTNFSTAFSSANYAAAGIAKRDSGQTNHHIINTKGDTAQSTTAHRWQTTINSISLNDPPAASVVYFGDQ